MKRCSGGIPSQPCGRRVHRFCQACPFFRTTWLWIPRWKPLGRSTASWKCLRTFQSQGGVSRRTTRLIVEGAWCRFYHHAAQAVRKLFRALSSVLRCFGLGRHWRDHISRPSSGTHPKNRMKHIFFWAPQEVFRWISGRCLRYPRQVSLFWR